MLLGPGIYDIDPAEYHADPALIPSLSRSVAKEIVECSPRHGYALCQRLHGGKVEIEEAGPDRQVIGSAVHDMFLRGLDNIAVIQFPTYATKEAKAQREAAMAAGKLPLKVADYDHAMRIVEALEAFRTRTGAFTLGKPEQTVIADEGTHWSRCMVDWLPDEPAAPLWDLKTTAGRATLKTWTNAAFATGIDMQAVHYARCVEFVREEPPDDMRFCVVEQEPPYGIKVFMLSAMGFEIGDARCKHARRLWIDGMNTGHWPSYSDEIIRVDPPVFVMREWEHLTASGGMRPAPSRQQLASEGGNRAKALGDAGTWAP